MLDAGNSTGGRIRRGRLRSQALGVEAIFAALFLPAGPRALDRLWDFQLHDGKAKGAWPWLSLALDPWEMPESPFYGAALAAIAAANAPASANAPKFAPISQT
jgi:hypothetical protein